jgi:PAS domain S-box-containing protein
MAIIPRADRPSGGSIRLRAAVLTSALIALSLVAVISYTFFAVHGSLIEGGEARASAAADQLAGIIGAPLPGRVAEVQRLVDHQSVRDALTNPSPAAQAAALARLKPVVANTQQHQTLELWNTSGSRVVGLQIPPTGGSVPLASALPNGVGVLPYVIVDGQIVSELVIPLRTDGAGSPTIGYLLSRRLATNTNSSTSDALNQLIGGGGRIMVGNQSGSVWTDITKQIEGPPIDVRTPGRYRYRTADGTRIASVAHVAGTPIAVVVDFPQTVMVAPAWSLLRQLSVVGLIFTLAAVAVVWRLSARVTQPLERLIDALGAVRDGDFSKRVEVDRATEVGRLAHAFNSMAAKIEAGLLELEARERELKAKDSRKAAMMNAALDGIFTVSPSGQVIDCNPAAERVFGYDHQEFICRNLGDLLLLPGYSREAGLAAYVEATGGATLGRRLEVQAQRRDEGVFPVEISLTSIHIDGTPFAAFVRDLTEQKAGEQSLLRGIVLEEENRRVIEASRLKSEFLANMSHELRTPLNAIIGFAELLYDGQVTPEMPQFKEFMHDILTSGQHLLQLINDVLDLSKVEAGRLEFHPEDTDLAQLVGEAIGILRTVAAQKRLTITQEVEPALGAVFVDRSRLKQVLYNYLSNAIKFTPEQGRIAVTVVADGESRFRLAVRDTGVGIAAADLPRLFIEFNQLEAGAAKTHQGTGLGLALTKRLVEAQGGTVGVDSVPGRGSTFSIVLPRRAEKGTAIAGPRSISSQRIGAPSVLVIEDDAADQEAIAGALVAAGFSVETATTREQALIKLASQTFDAITLDLILPDATGSDILRDLRSSERNRDVPVVVITVVAGDGAVAGFAVHDILTKPVDGHGLIGALERAGLSPGASGSVLVVDDDPGSLRLMAASLHQLGFESTCVERAVDGLRISERQAPLAVVLDLQMPGMDGFGFLEHFRRLPGCTHTPVIVWTVKDLTPGEYARLRSTVQGILGKGQAGSASVVEELRRFTTQPQGVR